MADEKIIEEHKHVVTETEEGIPESHTHKVIERDEPERKPEVTTTIVRETTIEEEED